MSDIKSDSSRGSSLYGYDFIYYVYYTVVVM